MRIIRRTNQTSYGQSNIFTSQNLYLGLLIFLILGMVHVPIVLRMVMIGCAIIPKQLHRIIWPVVISAAYFMFFKIPSEEIIIYSLVIFVTLCVIERQKSTHQNRRNEFLNLLFAMLSMGMLDFLSGFFSYGLKATYIGADGFPACFLRIFTIFFIAMGIRFLHMLSINIKICGLISYGIVFFLGIVHYWVMEITNSEFLLSDIKLLTTVATVISEVQIETASIIKFFVFLILMCGFFVAYFKLPFLVAEREIRKKQGAYALIFFVAAILFIRSDILTYSNYYGSVKYGVPCNLIINMKSFEKPSGYESYVEEIAKNATGSTVSNTTTTDSSPNIIVIMSEAFSDLSMVGDFETNKDYMPYTRSIMENYPSGTLYASVRGNNTVSSEMEFLTGIPTGLSMKGCDFYQLHLDEREESIVSLLEENHYQTIGIHPYTSAGYNRENAWKAFGFDETSFIDYFEGEERVRNFVSDAAFYDSIIEKYEESKGKRSDDVSPVFIYGISMQNHASYLSGYDGKITITDTASNGMEKSLNEYADVNEYLSLLYESDQALKELLTYFENQEEETIIVFYGDHQPLIDVDFYSSLTGKSFYDFTLHEQADVYKVPYFIWSNYGMAVDVPDEMSINYLSNTVLEVAGIKKDAWFTFVDEVYKTYPVITDHFMLIDNELVEKETVIDALDQIDEIDKNNPLHLLKQYQVWSYEKVK